MHMPNSKLKSNSSKLPFVFLNLAMTADGKITTANRAVSSFSSRRDREHMLELRATADAVMNGARTADLNPILMGPGHAQYRRLRLKRGFAEYNLRILVSGGGTLDPKAEVFTQRFSPIIILTTRRAPARQLEALRAVADEVKICGEREIDFHQALCWLRTKWNVRRLLCEGGGEVNGALFRAGLVDELHLTICPRIFGGRAAPTIADGQGVSSLRQAIPLELKSAKRHGAELFLVYRAKRKR
jgi:2,5-diamino-6-(ribosylamino)-4(3H)-pyrimidinone 5'-phosphate reductase